MKRFIPVLLLSLIVTNAFALKLGKSAPKITVYRAAPTQLVVYDARPELGLGVQEFGKKTQDAVADLGVRMVRRTLYWNKMESTEKAGLYESSYLSEWDTLVDECRKNGACLVVSIDGLPPGATVGDVQSLQRLARFAADMASRYPSVIYWEPLTELALPQTATNRGRPLPPAAKGKYVADVLRAVAPAIKAANPSAFVLCAVSGESEEFARGVFECGGKGFLDIIDIQWSVPLGMQPASDMSKKITGVLAEFGADGMPVWLVSNATPADPTACEDFFTMNNERSVFSKVFLPFESDAASPMRRWLQQSDVNQALFDNARSIANVFVPSKMPIVPVGYDFKPSEGGMEVQRVLVDTLAPTRIDLMFTAEPRPLKPGEKPAPTPRKGTRPIPDPFDI